MARVRNLKPGFFANEQLADCCPLARLLFQGLWLHADRDGRLEDRPRRLKAEILPYDQCDVDTLLSELERGGFIARYVAEETHCIQVLNFAKHQNPHPKEPASSLPAMESRVIKRQATEIPGQAAEIPHPAGPYPESLILNPESDSSANASESGATAAPTPDDDPKKSIFSDHLPWLVQASGKSEASVRTFLGKCCKEYGDAKTLAACVQIRDGPGSLPVNPFSAMKAILLEQPNGRHRKVSISDLSAAEIRDAMVRGSGLDLDGGDAGFGRDIREAAIGHRAS